MALRRVRRVVVLPLEGGRGPRAGGRGASGVGEGGEAGAERRHRFRACLPREELSPTASGAHGEEGAGGGCRRSSMSKYTRSVHDSGMPIYHE